MNADEHNKLDNHLMRLGIFVLGASAGGVITQQTSPGFAAAGVFAVAALVLLGAALMVGNNRRKARNLADNTEDEDIITRVERKMGFPSSPCVDIHHGLEWPGETDESVERRFDFLPTPPPPYRWCYVRTLETQGTPYKGVQVRHELILMDTEAPHRLAEAFTHTWTTDPGVRFDSELGWQHTVTEAACRAIHFFQFPDVQTQEKRWLL